MTANEPGSFQDIAEGFSRCKKACESDWDFLSEYYAYVANANLKLFRILTGDHD